MRSVKFDNSVMCFGRTGADAGAHAGAHAVATNVGIVYVALQSYLGSCVWYKFLNSKKSITVILDLEKDRTRRIVE